MQSNGWLHMHGLAQLKNWNGDRSDWPTIYKAFELQRHGLWINHNCGKPQVECFRKYDDSSVDKAILLQSHIRCLFCFIVPSNELWYDTETERLQRPNTNITLRHYGTECVTDLEFAENRLGARWTSVCLLVCFKPEYIFRVEYSRNWTWALCDVIANVSWPCDLGSFFKFVWYSSSVILS